MPPSTESSTLPRGFRYHGEDGERPTTPEFQTEELRQPSPPRQNKMKLKRRNHQANMSGPTEQFLASVAAADIPLPTIEVPEDDEMVDRSATPLPLAGYLAPQPRGSPPKTPIPEIDTSVGVGVGSIRKRDWYSENIISDESSRPSSALSSPSDCSDDSYFGSRLSRPSDDGSCTSPDSDFAGPFSRFSSVSRANGKGFNSAFVAETSEPPEIPNRNIRHKSRSDAPWSRDMSDHLWQVYQLYLQDPTVTPFRIGSSFVPPEGVIIRVSREAKRSWKGPKAPRQKHRHQTPNVAMGGMEYAGSPETGITKSGSLTPTDKNGAKAYPKWPHSSAATRAHLRELCKHDSDGHRRHRFGQSRSPTPFTQDFKKSSGHRTPQCYATKDMALVLATSSAPSMQSDGPLAKLAEQPKTHLPPTTRISQARRLGSPFVAQTYGPSRSKVFHSMRPSPPRNHSEPGKEAQLRSPVNFDRPRSLNGTMKRRAQYALEEELSPTGGLSRASILDEQLFRNPEEVREQLNPQRRVRRSRGFTLGDEDLVPRPLFAMASEKTASNPTPSYALHSGFPTNFGSSMGDSAGVDMRRRLGSPFDESSVGHHTFPRRMVSPPSSFVDTSIDEIMAFHNPASGTVRRRHGPYATVGSRDFGSRDFGSEVAAAAAEGQTLEQRLKGLEGKLREYNGQGL